VIVDESGLVHIQWQFVENYEAVSFRIEREINEQVDTLYMGNTIEDGTWVDMEIHQPGEVVYRVIAVAADGFEQEIERVVIEIPVPSAFILSQGFPNPFRERATVRYFLKQDGVVQLGVFNTSGQQVLSLHKGFKEGGQWYEASIDGRALPVQNNAILRAKSLSLSEKLLSDSVSF